MIELRDVWYRYPEASDYAIRGVTLTFGSGLYLVTGPNGAGKTTLLLLTAGLLKPTRGLVLMDGVEVYGRRELRRHIGVLFQNPDLSLFNPTVYDELAYSPRQLGMDEAAIRDQAERWLSHFGLDRGLLGRHVHSLSYGQKKLVALIAVLMYEPKVLLLDEPHTNLAKSLVERVMEVSLDVVRRGGTVVVASHEVSIYEGLADAAILLEDGKVYGVKAAEGRHSTAK